MLDYRVKQYRIIYTFRNAKFGFNNSVTVMAQSIDEAINKAKNEVSGVYGSGLLKRFDFKLDPTHTGVIVR